MMIAKKVLFAVALAASVCVSASAFTQNGAKFGVASNMMLANKVRKGGAPVASK